MTSITWNQMIESCVSQVSIPEEINELSMLEAALAYSANGFYVIPVKAGTKNPGSYLGGAWNEKSSRDSEVITRWFSRGDLGIALHMGKSNVLAVDVDSPSQVPLWLRGELLQDRVPFQSTRESIPERGHYLFTTDKNQKYGNGLGSLDKGFGDIRAGNGVIIASPSLHSSGGRYRWERTGILPPLPARIHQHLPTGTGTYLPSLTSKAVQSFIDQHQGSLMPHLLHERISNVRAEGFPTVGRHQIFVGFLCRLLSDVSVGFYSASDALTRCHNLFNEVKPPDEQSPREFEQIVSWAMAQVIKKFRDEKLMHALFSAPHLIHEVITFVDSHVN